jgi:hypothetical protein
MGAIPSQGPLTQSNRVRPFRQPFILPAAGTAAAGGVSGASQQTADGPPAGFADNVTLAFPTAPVGATFFLYISGILCGQWTGPTPYGPLLIVNNEQVLVNASGLTNGQSYPGLWMGTRCPVDRVSPSAPLFGPTSVLVGNLPASSLAIQTQQFLAVSENTIPLNGITGYQLSTFSFPPGTDVTNYNTAIVTVTGTPGHVTGRVWVADANGLAVLTYPLVPNSMQVQHATVILPIFVGGSPLSEIFVQNSDTVDSILVDIALSQEALEPSIGSAPGRINQQGSTYVSPMAPGTFSGDHPLTELSLASANLAANANVLAAPGGGVRYRIFYADLSLRAGAAASIGALSFGVPQLVVAIGFCLYRQLNGAPSGIPMAANTAVSFAIAGTPNCDMTIVYTTENV